MTEQESIDKMYRILCKPSYETMIAILWGTQVPTKHKPVYVKFKRLEDIKKFLDCYGWDYKDFVLEHFDKSNATLYRFKTTEGYSYA